MFAVVVTLELIQGAQAQLLPALKENAAASLREEPGCTRFDICTDASMPDHVFLYELYADRAAFDAHLASAHFKAFDAFAAPLIAAKEVRTYSQVTS
ncbi:MAG: putative quinol monooxygenase [Pseudomonadota bacterium]